MLITITFFIFYALTLYHSHDFCSEHWATKTFSDKLVSENFKYFGENREQVVGWMKTLLKDVPKTEQNFVLMDSTHSLSLSEILAINAKEMNIIFIADKGFFSRENIDRMEKENLSYIVPLHRNNTLIVFSLLQRPDFKKDLQYFIFQNRIIRYYSYQKDGYSMIIFLDERLRISEEKDYLSRIDSHPETHFKQGFDEKLHRFGTLTIIYKFTTQTDKEEKRVKKKKQALKKKETEQIVYESYKQRNEIEVMFDSYKIILMPMFLTCKTGMYLKAGFLPIF